MLFSQQQVTKTFVWSLKVNNCLVFVCPGKLRMISVVMEPVILWMACVSSCRRDNRRQGTVSACCGSAPRVCLSRKQKISSTCQRATKICLFFQGPLKLWRFVPVCGIVIPIDGSVRLKCSKPNPFTQVSAFVLFQVTQWISGWHCHLTARRIPVWNLVKQAALCMRAFSGFPQLLSMQKKQSLIRLSVFSRIKGKQVNLFVPTCRAPCDSGSGVNTAFV